MQTDKQTNRSKAVEFFKDNSRPLAEAKLGDWDLLFRLGDNGSNFLLLDMKENGFTLFYPEKSSLIEETITHFKEKTFINYLALKP